MTTPLIIKLGGALLTDRAVLSRFFYAIVVYKQKSNRKVIIIHGGGCFVDQVMERFGLPITKLRGRRVTPLEHIAIVVGILSGTVNKILLAEAQKQQLKVVGLSLADGDTLSVKPMDEKLGCVGTPYAGKTELLNMLLSSGYLPIISSVGIDEQGHLLNVNSDDVAAFMAKIFDADLLMLSDVAGILDKHGDFIDQINMTDAQQLIESGVISQGMAIKVRAASLAAKQLNKAVSISTLQQCPEQLVELFNGRGIKTTLVV